jgi:hypothetical protein
MHRDDRQQGAMLSDMEPQTLALLLHTIQNERMAMEQLGYTMLCRWFVRLGLDDPVWARTVLSRMRDLVEAG